MRIYSAEIEAAILEGVIMPREFLSIHARNRVDRSLHFERLWSDNYDITAEVLDPDDGTPQSYSWQGVAGLVDIDPLPRVSNLTVSRIDIKLLAFGDDLDRIIRTYDVRQAPVRLWRGFMNTASRKMLGPAELRFIGFIDEAPEPELIEGQEVQQTLVCVSHSQEMTRSSTEKRSHESQLRRHAGDDFFKGVATVADQTFFWGSKVGNLAIQDTSALPKGVM